MATPPIPRSRRCRRCAVVPNGRDGLCSSCRAVESELGRLRLRSVQLRTLLDHEPMARARRKEALDAFTMLQSRIAVLEGDVATVRELNPRHPRNPSGKLRRRLDEGP